MLVPAWRLVVRCNYACLSPNDGFMSALSHGELGVHMLGSLLGILAAACRVHFAFNHFLDVLDSLGCGV